LSGMVFGDGPDINGMLTAITLTSQCVFFAASLTWGSDQSQVLLVACILLFVFEIFSVAHHWGLWGSLC
jgi:hypothetical protein